MEFKEYIAIIRRDFALFLVLIAIIVGGALVWQQSQPKTYEATLLLNVGRTKMQPTEEYTYDSFYRLQADERFADTVVRWLEAPRVVEDIYADAQVFERGEFTGKRLSSQVIEVTYQAKIKKDLSRLSGSMVTVLNRYTESLNKEKNDANGWFVILGSDPVVADARIPFSPVLGISLLVGLFLSFWIVLLKHYFSPSKTQ
ncbi:MAG: hypothetical protein AAB708_02895 [Patescibacteria group bacterium]